MLTHTFSEAANETGMNRSGLKYRCKEAAYNTDDTDLRKEYDDSRKLFQGRRSASPPRVTRSSRLPSRSSSPERPPCPEQDRDDRGHFMPLPPSAAGCRKKKKKRKGRRMTDPEDPLAKFKEEQRFTVESAVEEGDFRLAIKCGARDVQSVFSNFCKMKKNENTLNMG